MLKDKPYGQNTADTIAMRLITEELTTRFQTHASTVLLPSTNLILDLDPARPRLLQLVGGGDYSTALDLAALGYAVPHRPYLRTASSPNSVYTLMTGYSRHQQTYTAFLIHRDTVDLQRFTLHSLYDAILLINNVLSEIDKNIRILSKPTSVTVSDTGHAYIGMSGMVPVDNYLVPTGFVYVIDLTAWLGTGDLLYSVVMPSTGLIKKSSNDLPHFGNAIYVSSDTPFLFYVAAVHSGEFGVYHTDITAAPRISLVANGWC